MRKVEVAERRARLARRHCLAPAHRAGDILGATQSIVCLHGTDPVTDDLEVTAAVTPWAAFLPPLDPTTMGWFERGWYLGSYKSQLFDSSGNAGPSAWWDGRIVGSWRQRDGGEVELQMLEDVGAEGLAALTLEAERLTEWIGGSRVLPRFPSLVANSSG